MGLNAAPAYSPDSPLPSFPLPESNRHPAHAPLLKLKGGKTHLELFPVARKAVHTVSAHNLWPIGHFLCLRLPWVPAHLSICQLQASS